MIFDQVSRDALSAAYPEVPVRFNHALHEHSLLELDALAALGERLPAASVEYNRGDVPVGLGSDAAPANGLGIGETIRNVATSGSWAVLKNVEQDPAYAALLRALLGELEEAIAPHTGPLLKMQAYVFISSPNAVTPYHFDPEHNILLQVRGTKVMMQFPAGDPRFAPDTVHESYHLGGARTLPWNDALLAGGTAFDLAGGDALYVPVMAPHFVRNGPEPSLSLSITWRSAWSFAEADARALNGVLRRVGITPRAPARYPASNRAKAMVWRVIRRFKSAS